MAAWGFRKTLENRKAAQERRRQRQRERDKKRNDEKRKERQARMAERAERKKLTDPAKAAEGHFVPQSQSLVRVKKRRRLGALPSIKAADDLQKSVDD